MPELRTGYKYVSLGTTFAFGIILFTALGYGLDRWLHLLPLLTITGTLVGFVLSFMWVYGRLRQFKQEDDAKRAGKQPGGQ
jgi:F0F1-type ATP synthase assembly protein I